MIVEDIDTAAEFLLNCPPLEEIGGPIVEVIEQYRFKMMTEQQAMEILTNNFRQFLQRVANDNIAINNLAQEFVN